MTTGKTDIMERYGIKVNDRIKRVILLLSMMIVTVIRICLANMIPMLLQGDAKYDDFLMIRYAETITEGNWLGDYSLYSLLKTISAPILMIIGRFFGIQYNVFCVILYILAVGSVVLALDRFTNNRLWTFATYTYLLYSPIMFHEENVQKVYRGGFIVPFALLVMAAVIGIFENHDNCKRMMLWSLILSLTFPIFWYLKEDSIWILPFVLSGLAISAILIVVERSREWKRMLVIAVMPVLVLVLSTVAYKSINYHYYGVWTDVDRNDTYFAKTISDILHIEGAGEGTSWITRDTIETACDNSITLNGIRRNLMEEYDHRAEDNGDVDGDFVIAAFREAGADSGLYDLDGSYTEKFYKNVHEELEASFDSGRLVKSDSIFISGIARGYTLAEIREYYGKRLKDSIKLVLFYEHNETGIKKSVGEDEKIRRMAVYAGDDYISDKTTEERASRYKRGADIAEHITQTYRRITRIIIVIAMIGMIWGLISAKKKNCNSLWLIVISGGLALTALLMIVAVLWFCNFLTDWKVYDYCSAIIPAIELIEMIGIYFAGCAVSKLFRMTSDKHDKKMDIQS